MLHRVTVVLHQNRRLALQLRHQLVVDSRPPKGRFERLSRDSKFVRFAIVRSSQHHKGAILQVWSQPLIRCLVTLPSMFRTGMRRGDPDHSVVCRSGTAGQIRLHHFAQRIDVCGIRLPRKRGLPHRTLRKGRMTAFLEPCVGLVFEKARLTQPIGQKLSRISNLGIPRQPGKLRLQVEACLHAIEKEQATDEEWRNDQGGIGVSETVANQEPRSLTDRRGHKVQIGSKPGKNHLPAPALENLWGTVSLISLHDSPK